MWRAFYKVNLLDCKFKKELVIYNHEENSRRRCTLERLTGKPTIEVVQAVNSSYT